MKMNIEIIGTENPQVVLRALADRFCDRYGYYAMPCDAEYSYENGKLEHADGDEPIRVKLTWEAI